MAANLCSVAIGTETDGSTIWPAQTNSVVGLKPTVGLISRTGIVPIAHSQDTAGLLARTVPDVAILLGSLVGVDPQDPATEGRCDKRFTDYTQFLAPDGMRGARIGVARNFFGFDSRVDRIVENCIESMARLGAEIVDPANVETANALGATELKVLLYECKANLNAYLARLGASAPVHSLEELIAFNEQNRDSVMPYFGQETLLLAQEKGPLNSPEYAKALETNYRLARTEGIDATLNAHQLDAIVAPSGGPACLTDLINGDHLRGGSSSPAAVAGYPNLTVPAGYIFGLPVGISFFSGAYQEPILIRLAFAFERATQIRRQPQFLASADLANPLTM